MLSLSALCEGVRRREQARVSAECVGDLVEGLRREDHLAAPAALADGKAAGLRFVEPFFQPVMP
jgi:hypothetical protein